MFTKVAFVFSKVTFFVLVFVSNILNNIRRCKFEKSLNKSLGAFGFFVNT